MPTPEYLTVEEVAAVLRQTPYTVQRKIREKQLHAIKLGTRWLITPDDLDTYLGRAAEPAQAAS